MSGVTDRSARPADDRGDRQADTVFFGGVVRTMEPPAAPGRRERALPTAVAVKDGVIVRVGSDREIRALAGPHTRSVDLAGRLLLPGFHDSHLHLLSYGLSLEKVYLDGATSIDEIVRRGRDFLRQSGGPRGGWIQGRGWNNELWPGRRFPNRYDLDRISTDHPVTYTRTCGHIIAVNSKALEVMGVTRDTPQLPGGQIDVDERGEPLGIFREEARVLVYEAIPRLEVADIKRLLVLGAQRALRCGLTALQTDDFEAVPEEDFPRVIEAYTQLAQEGALPVRVFEQCLLPRPEQLRRFLELGYTTGYQVGRFKIGPLKLLADGSLGGRTAFLDRPYADCPSTCGIGVFSQQQLDELVETAHRAGMPAAIHCIGNATMQMALDSIERAQLRWPRADIRHSIIHCQITDQPLLQRFRALGVIAHIQPVFVAGDWHIAADRVGEELAATSYNWQTMVQLGIPIACGSDCPVERFDVMENIYCAVTRQDFNGQPAGGWYPQQRLTVEQAVYGHTMGAAYASYDERVSGSLSVGKRADMAVVDRDIFTIPPAQIKEARVVMTVLDGEIVYEREER